MKLSDFVADFLARQGIRHVFGLTGGAVVHLFDSVDKHPSIQPIFNHHEQAGAFAAEAYSKINGLGACFTTTGPGVTNAITGLAAAWLDSVPCIYISGQTRLEHTTLNKPIRQLGTQQLDVIPLVGSLTKYAVMLEDPKTIKYHLQKAAYLAKSGRPGPVWIDIPLNFQWMDIDPDTIPEFRENEFTTPSLTASQENLAACLKWLTESKRPLVLAGSGVRLARGENELRAFIEKHRLPYVTSWGGVDLLPNDAGMNLGRPGVAGQRGANLAVQNCDLLICIGSHLCIPLTGTIYEAFAREAKVIMVDIDQAELNFKTVHVELPIQMDAKEFLGRIVAKEIPVDLVKRADWLEKCSEYRQLNKLPADWYEQSDKVNQYVFIDLLSDQLENEDMVVVDGGGTNVYISYQAFKIKEGQRMILSTGLCAMGSGLPEAIGVCFANNEKRTICLCGDGSLQLNIQELQTIVHHQLPIKIFVFNNDGYNSIRQTQKGFLNENYCGSETKGGMSLPDFLQIGRAYGLTVFRIETQNNLAEDIGAVLNATGPVLCEVIVPRAFEVVPTQGFAKNSDGTFRPQPLEDMAPLLDRDKFNKLMVVKPWEK